MKILITGVAGFIGSNLATRLLKEGHEVAGIDNLAYGLRENIPAGVKFHLQDIRDTSIYPLFDGVDVAFHLAAKNCIADCQCDPVETADINVRGTVNVFEAAKRAMVKKIVYAESSALYEGCCQYPTSECNEAPESFYAVSKMASKYFADAYHRYFGLTFTALRYFCVYGPVQDYRRTIPPVMSAFIIKLLKGEAPIIYGTGEKRRDFVYVDDINDFHVQCLTDERTNNQIFNLGSGVNYSVNDIYAMITDLLGIHVPPVRKPDLPGEAETTLADISAAQSLGWVSKTDLRTGLNHAITYIKNEMEKGNI
ncbi:MAG: NAD-dependent epimerase/dehydratase family protein [Desulfobacterales bacterium]|nr:NAD-dependent epimerase/dehydratase family protein [Desulfobacterales bacterium]